MSIKISSNDLSSSQIKAIIENLEFSPPPSKYGSTNTEPINPYRIKEKYIYVPYAYARESLQLIPSSSHVSSDVLFLGNLFDYQQEYVKRIIHYLQSDNGSCILSVCISSGKTIMAIYVSTVLKLKTIVVVCRTILIKQWKDEIEKFSTARVQMLKSKRTPIDLTADMYVIYAQNVKKYGDALVNIGFVIVDEAHLITTKMLIQSMQYLTPAYCIALTATPKRPDGMDILLGIYFGKNMIERALYRKHYVYKINTGLKIEMHTKKNRLDWDRILRAQASDAERNRIIPQIIRKHPKRHFLILCKRINHIKLISSILDEEKLSHDYFYGSMSDPPANPKILVTTISKCGVGFNCPILTALIIAADVQEFFIQYLGRVFRSEEHIPIIYDLVDDNYQLYKHWLYRESIYLDHGGVLL